MGPIQAQRLALAAYANVERARGRPMILRDNPRLKNPARRLRRNMTDAETRLWQSVRR